MSQEEMRLARRWYVEEELAPSDIARRLGRNKSTLTRLLVKRVARKTLGRKRALSAGVVDRLTRTLARLQQQADGRYEVTVAMLKKSARVQASKRTILRALHIRGIRFRPMREKPVLTDEDVADRKEFADAYGRKPAVWWTTHVHMAIDVKHFSVFLHGGARARAAQSGARGAYRTRGQGLGKGYVKASKSLKYNPGARGVQVLAGVGDGKVLVWEYIDGKQWSGNVAAKLYEEAVAPALAKAYPGKRAWNVLEDNDPAGFKSSKAIAAKAKAHIKTFSIPRRSPALNVCDYFLWAEVNRRMRATEKRWRPAFRESRRAYLARLRRTAMSIPANLLRRSMQDMKRRCCRLQAAGGGHFEEGGK